MLSRHNPIDVEAALVAAPPTPPFPPIADRPAWQAAREAIGGAEARALIARAEAAAPEPVPSLPATLFLEYNRRGERDSYQQPRARRREALAALVLAECLEDRGRFLDPILDWAWAICEESSWVLPAHQSVLTDVERPVVDLGVAETALGLAELDHLVGAKLDPLLGKRIRDEVDRRCFVPFLTRHDFWWLYNTEKRTVNNWTAVCVGGVVGAATYLESDPARLAELIARGARSLDDYLATFDEDGGSSEGPGYWSYGFGYFTVLAHLVENRTGGRVRFLDGEEIRSIARYPLRTALSPGLYANFSDCDRYVRLASPHLAFLARRLDLPELVPLAHAQPPAPRQQHLTWGLRTLFWQPEAPAEPVRPARDDFFRGMQWLVARVDPADSDGLVLAAKGGHNQEMHNQNDVGNLIVHFHRESLVADLGRGRYTRDYFGARRYEHLVNSSLGHSVPVVNGLAQSPGRDHAAALLDRQIDGEVSRLALELRAAYPPDADLASLRRTVELHRDRTRSVSDDAQPAARQDEARPDPRGWVRLEDRVRFASGPGTFESILTTFSDVEIGDDVVLIRGERGALRVEYDRAIVSARLDRIPDVDLAEGPTAVNRIVFTLRAPAVEAAVGLRLLPVD